MKETHHIDTSVVLGAFTEKDKWHYECVEYLNKAGYKYVPKISVSVAGEIFMIVEEKFNEAFVRELFFSFFDRIVRRKGMSFDSFTARAAGIFKSIRSVDYSIEPLDALHLSILLDNGVKTFVTLDKLLLESKEVEREFGIRMVHPGES